ncbi:hypothetical protein GP486_006459 [Trichoglossum hirsutum]|uniref:Uncharacterized protein n=1 Tax=Trichoglossum hirsutum TaxID=265104 RepID=A0A9P8IDN1_9PEZI|nr:hypothetical protein GP486_006459 [Trichoglossum hirsutum]
MVNISKTRGSNQPHDIEDGRLSERRQQNVDKISALQRELEEVAKTTRCVSRHGLCFSNYAPDTEKGLSWQPSISDVDQDAVSEGSAIPIGTYRYDTLERAKISIHPIPPENLPSLNAILKREVSNERKREISDIAERVSKRFFTRSTTL